MVRYFFHISYIGTKYRGIQRMENYKTIQGVIEDALCSLKTATVSDTCFASRTDSGVHALMNAFHVDLEHKVQGEVYQPSFLRKQLNSYLKENEQEIIITNASIVPNSFQARYHAKWRSYVYRLAILRPELRVHFPETYSCVEYLPISLVNRCHAVPSNLNINLVKDALDLYIGHHDFTAFTKAIARHPWKTTKRIIDEIKLYELPSCCSFDDPRNSNVVMWEVYIKSASFLYHQVRKMVGVALLAGFGVLSIPDIKTLLKCPTPQLMSKVYVAPACGLYLAHIHYEKEGFIGTKSSDVYKDSDVTT